MPEMETRQYGVVLNTEEKRNDITIQTQSPKKARIVFNVGGRVFEVYRRTLRTFPDSKLAKLNENSEDFDVEQGHYFFDRNPLVFEAVLEACRTGELHIPRDICSSMVKRELDFWDISPASLSPCCWKSYYRADNDTKTIAALSEFYQRDTNIGLMLTDVASRRTKLWLFLDAPKSSRYAMIWSIFMTLVVISATFVLTSENATGFLVGSRGPKQKETLDFFMKHAGLYNSSDRDVTNAYRLPHPALKTTEIICFSFITTDLTLRLFVCPNLLHYIMCPITICEILASLGDWLDLYLDSSLETLKSETGFYLVYSVKFLLVFQSVRLFRVAKHIMAFNIMSLSVHSSMPEIGVLVSVLLILTTVFGWLMYLVEMNNDRFASMFAAMYWALITLTTVGYGDLFPNTILGHVVACTCAVCGIVILALPIGVIAARFNAYYNHHKYVSKHIQSHKPQKINLQKIINE